MPFEDASLGAVVCFTMLHHVPPRVLQDRLFAEARRVLRPDSTTSLPFRLLHLGDTMARGDPETPGGLVPRRDRGPPRGVPILHRNP